MAQDKEWIKKVKTGKGGPRVYRYGLLGTDIRKRYPTIFRGAQQFRRAVEVWVQAHRDDEKMPLPEASLISEAMTMEVTRRLCEWQVSRGQSKSVIGDMRLACQCARRRDFLLRLLGFYDSGFSFPSQKATKGQKPDALQVDWQRALRAPETGAGVSEEGAGNGEPIG
jgi:hypothetical protein